LRRGLARRSLTVVDFGGAVGSAGSGNQPGRHRRSEAFNSTHADLARSAGQPAQLANDDSVEALARLVYYWSYPALDATSRTSMWEMKARTRSEVRAFVKNRLKWKFVILYYQYDSYVCARAHARGLTLRTCSPPL
jgi:hypothetical protein